MEEGQSLSLDMFREVALQRARKARLELDTELAWGWQIVAEAEAGGANMEGPPWSDCKAELRNLQDIKPEN